MVYWSRVGNSSCGERVGRLDYLVGTVVNKLMYRDAEVGFSLYIQFSWIHQQLLQVGEATG